MTFRGAIGFSAAFHVVLLTAVPSGAWLAPTQKYFEVSYLPPVSQPRVLDPVPSVPSALVAPAPRVSTPDLAPVPAVRPVTRNDVAVAEPHQRLGTSSAARMVPPRSAASPPRRGTSSAARMVPPRSPAISSLPDKEFLFLDHKEQVRKHLKARLNYPSILTDGTVRLRVILGPEGSFKQAVVLETSDPRLAGLAVKDAQAAAPYPRLPPKFHPRQVRYEFLVRYKPE